MRFEWDEVKNRRNVKKNKISFDSAKVVFDDPDALADRDREVADEERWQTVGMISGLVVAVAHTYREEGEDLVIRIISARKATPTERNAYAQSHEASG